MKAITGPDGYTRPDTVERKINLAVVTVLGTDAGREVMNYLRSISIDRVCGPHAGDAELRHLEGMRFIVGVLSQRIALGHREKEQEPHATRRKRTPAVPAARKRR